MAVPWPAGASGSSDGAMLRWLAAWRRNKKLSRGLPVRWRCFRWRGCQCCASMTISPVTGATAAYSGAGESHHRPDGQSVDQKWFVVYGDSSQQTLDGWRHLPPRWRKRKKTALSELPHHSAELPGAAGGRFRPAKTAAPTVTKALQNAGLTAVNRILTPCQ